MFSPWIQIKKDCYQHDNSPFYFNPIYFNIISRYVSTLGKVTLTIFISYMLLDKRDKYHPLLLFPIILLYQIPLE